MRTLDDLLQVQQIKLQGYVLLKLDVQGHEDAVIRGAPKLLSAVKLVIAEVSFEQLYEGQPLFADIHAQLGSFGFVYQGSLEQRFSSNFNRYLFADAVFVKTS